MNKTNYKELNYTPRYYLDSDNNIHETIWLGDTIVWYCQHQAGKRGVYGDICYSAEHPYEWGEWDVINDPEEAEPWIDTWREITPDDLVRDEWLRKLYHVDEEA